MSFYVEGSKYEPVLKKHSAGLFKSSDADRQIKVFESQFLRISRLSITIINIAREIIISQCSIECSNTICSITIQPGLTSGSNKNDDLTFFSFQIINSSMSESIVQIFRPSKTSFVFIKMVNLIMFNVIFEKVILPRYCRLGFHVENTIWLNNHPFYNHYIMYLDKAISVSIISSELTTNCNECPLLYIFGVGDIK